MDSFESLSMFELPVSGHHLYILAVVPCWIILPWVDREHSLVWRESPVPFLKELSQSSAAALELLRLALSGFSPRRSSLPTRNLAALACTPYYVFG
jgi:hypothetical protein